MQKILLASLLLSSSLAFAFPITIEHKFGTTVIEQQPERVASVDYNGADNLLALGVQPVAIRYWYGDYPRAVWPWAEELLSTEPAILKGDLNFEQIAATNPDLIIALWSGIDEQAYQKLSLIAPVVAVPEGVGDYSLPWDQLALTVGKAVGLAQEAEQQVTAIKQQLAEVAAAHPDWQGKTAAVAFAWSSGNPGVYNAQDIRPLLLSQMGFRTTDAVDALADSASAFALQLSAEDLSPIDGDLIIWVSTDPSFASIRELSARPFLKAVKEGREVFTNPLLGSAFSHASLLSLPYAIDRLVPMIQTALDGDPGTHADDR